MFLIQKRESTRKSKLKLNFQCWHFISNLLMLLIASVSLNILSSSYNKSYAQTVPNVTKNTTISNLDTDKRSWQQPENLNQLSREELINVLKKSPFAFIEDSFSDIPDYLLRILLSIEAKELEPWIFPIKTTDEALINHIETSASTLMLPKTLEEVTTKKIYNFSLNQALEFGLTNNRDIQLQNIAVESNHQTLRKERAELFPKISLRSGISHQDGITQKEQYRYSFFPHDGQSSRNYTETGGYKRFADAKLEISYSYPLLWGTLQPRLRKASINVDQSKLQFEIEVRDVQEKIILGFYDIQEQQARMVITAQSLIRSTQNFWNATTRVESEKGKQLDLLSAKVRMLQDQQSLFNAIASFYQTVYEFANLLELSFDAVVLPSAPLQQDGKWNFSLEESILRAYKQRLDLDVLELQQDKLQASLDKAYAEALPTISFKATGATLINFNSEDSFINSGRGLSSRELRESKTFRLDYSVGLFLEWSLQGGQSVARIEQAKLELKSNQLTFANQRDNIREEVVRAYFDLVSNLKNIEASRLEVEVARQELDEAQKDIKAGLINQNDLSSAEEDFTTAQFNLLGTVIGYNKALTRLKRVTGDIN